jgi:putative ABC transport system substrate-binding protein
VLLLWLGLPSSLFAFDIAILKSSDIAAYNQAVAGFRAEIGEAATLTEYDLVGDVARGRKMARKVRGSDAGLVVAVGLKAALVAKLELPDVPIIYCMVLDPEKHDLRGPNVAGISLRVPMERQFSTMRALLPKLKFVGVIYDPDKTGPLIEEARRLAGRAGFELVERQVRSEKDLPGALRSLTVKMEALWLVPDSTVLTEDSIRFVLGTSLDHNIPVIGFSSEFVRNGALAGLSISPEDIGRQVGVLTKRAMNGANSLSPATMPPDRIRLAVNLKTAKYLGLSLSQDLIGRADEVY